MKTKKIMYFADCMFSGDIESAEEEFNLQVAPELKRNGIVFEKVKCVESPPFGENYDVLFFDWGGMSIGNDMLGSFCRQIIQEAKDRPNTYYVMTSSFTKYAMEDALERLSDVEKLHNVFLNILDFAEFYKKYK